VSLGVSPQLFISSLAKSHFRERVQCEPSIVYLLAVLVDYFPLAKKFATRAHEKVARLHARAFGIAVGGLSSGRRSKFLCVFEDRYNCHFVNFYPKSIILVYSIKTLF